MIILGIDPGYAIVGYGILEYSNNHFTIIHYGAVTTPAGMPFNRRLQIIYDELDVLISKYKPLADEKKKTFSVSGTCTAKADRKLISRAIETLITNALKYSLPDSTIKISADNKAFVIKNRCKDSIVGDEKVFCEPFKKADNSRSNNSGTGIGLTIVKSITTLHGFGLEIKAQNGEFVAKIIL